MHEESCGCECCRNYSVKDEEAALDNLGRALEDARRDGSALSPNERSDLDLAEVVTVDAGLVQPVPAVMFHPPSRVQSLKAGFTYRYLLDSEPTEIAASILSQIREHLSE
jgi:hypothetical protein